MPEARQYIVSETRQVKVRATCAADAVRIASAAFDCGQDEIGKILPGKAPEDVWGNTITKIRTTDISAMED